MPTYPDFESLEHRLIVANTPYSPAYIHGMIVGMISMDLVDSHRCWEAIQEKIPTLRLLPDTTRKLLELVIVLSMQQLNDNETGVLPFLPKDEHPLAYRLGALADWVEGFLEGLNLGIEIMQVLLAPDAVGEILRDFMAIKEVIPEDDSEENEKHYIELVEFVRVGVLLIHEECKQAKIKEEEVSSHLH